MSDDVKKTPTWGYKGSEAKIFQLGPDESLPEGWADSPAPAEDVGSEASAPDAPSPEGADAPDVEILKAENASLKEQLESANARIAELEAPAAEEEAAGTEPEPGPVEIPEDWAETGAGTHFKRIKLAKQLSPEMADAISSDADAIEIIKEELAKRG